MRDKSQQLTQFWDVRFSIFETNRTIFFKLVLNHTFIKCNFLKKKNPTASEPVLVFWGNFFQKMNFFQKFWHFWNQLNELIGKMVLFLKFDQLSFLALLSWKCQILTSSFWPKSLRKHNVDQRHFILSHLKS